MGKTKRNIAGRIVTVPLLTFSHGSAHIPVFGLGPQLLPCTTVYRCKKRRKADLARDTTSGTPVVQSLITSRNMRMKSSETRQSLSLEPVPDYLALCALYMVLPK